ncbi:FAD-dependent oxidoreductase [Stenotrophobium rhamnosiphilum]|uniref:Monooxygenase n=1 Tax=Stenotrophobium rhamnosiphilum TaxID=2029166 RepID=A0A2T5MCN9_9GAMM|nr:FAD-dependent oxidoreductase [Stenotrophobium rhamnosiphilum]PTU30317.1 monooxygenase [Stenotrophobium rhamnosiphilum]
MNIVIIGAGVAGASAALALVKQGHQIQIYERRPLAATMGAGLVIWPNASFILSSFGVLPYIAAVSGRPKKMRRIDQEDNPLGHIDIPHLEKLMGSPAYSILRCDLQSILLKRLASLGIEVAYGYNAHTIQLGADGRCTVRFDNGHTVSPDLIIGADGRKDSVARQYVAGDNSPVYQGFVNWLGVAEFSSPVIDEVAISDYWGCGERFGLVGINPRKVYWAAAQADATEHDAIEADHKEVVAELFDSWPAPISKVIRATEAHAIRKIRVYDLDPLAVWHRDNVLLVGDAAHAPLPTSGQGACQAIEDAWHLAACLEKASADLPSALEAFTQLRKEKTSAITVQAREFASALFSTDPEVCRIRDQRAKAADPILNVSALAAGWGAGLPMPIQIN